mmetsp:Transcript_8265/g.9614  ORF Transcript_8265/g.9614 Transcript_8265/m.9614 type:complete len:97 (-) Transcript_8265:1101-1391(-)
MGNFVTKSIPVASHMEPTICIEDLIEMEHEQTQSHVSKNIGILRSVSGMESLISTISSAVLIWMIDSQIQGGLHVIYHRICLGIHLICKAPISLQF